jgi:hypothetical protein
MRRGPSEVCILRAGLHLEAGPIPLEADCMKFQPFLGWRRPKLYIILGPFTVGVLLLGV